MWYMFFICRDIKLTNILLVEEGHCKLADFGVAAPGVFPGMTLSAPEGTVGYQAPEVIIIFYFQYDSFIFIEYFYFVLMLL